MKKFLLCPFIVSLFLLSMVHTCSAEPAETTAEILEPQLTASLDRESARIGEMVWLTLQYRLPAGARIPDEPEIKGIEELTISERVQEINRIQIRFLVDSLGQWKSTPFSIVYLDKNGKKNVMNADPVSLSVLSNLGEKPEEARLRPIQDIIPVEPAWLRYLPWVGALAGLFVIIATVIWWYRKRRARELLPEVIAPPHVRAEKEIDGLEAQALFEKGQVKAFYFILSEILRRYMESIRDFPAVEYTTEEIAYHIRSNDEDRKILPLLRQADLVKFADLVPTPHLKDEDILAARSYIRETGLPLESAHGAPGNREDGL